MRHRNLDRDARYLNIWEVITSQCSDDCQKTAVDGTMMPGQEISIAVYSDGWKVEVFSCYPGYPRWEVAFPRDGSDPSIRKIPARPDDRDSR